MPNERIESASAPDESGESSGAGVSGYELDWNKLPYPRWLYCWVEREMGEIINSGITVQHTRARAIAKERIDKQFKESGIPAEFLEENQPTGSAAFLIRESIRDSVEADQVSPSEAD